MGALIRNSLAAWLSGAIIGVLGLHANAAGLGSLEVKSVLGEPLRAEVSVAAAPSELPSLAARLASPSAYEAAGLVYSGIVSRLAVALVKDGERPVLTITSAAPINEPVVDLLIELTWSSGRVSREYTAFIDPPFIVAERERRRADKSVEEPKKADAAPAGAETSAASLPDAPTPQPLPEETGADTVSAADTNGEPTSDSVTVTALQELEETELGPVETIGGSAPTLLTTSPSVSTSDQPTGSVAAETQIGDMGSLIGVIRGDTLSEIALANKPAGVTLEQVLVVLFRNNPEAFSGNNMNRLRAGKIIRLPDPAEYGSVPQQQALEQVRAQYKDWRAYRERVAIAASQLPLATEQPAQQAAVGTVTPKVQEQAPTASEAPSEVVRLSKGEPGTAGQGGAGEVRALQEKLVASERALTESTERVARLEKIIEDLRKLAEVKSQDMAQLQSQAGTAQAPAAPTAAPDLPREAPGEATPAGEQPTLAKPEVPAGTEQAAVATTGESSTAQSPTPLPAAPAGDAAKAPAAAAQKPAGRPPPPPPAPSLLDQALERPYLLAVPLVVLLLIAFGVSRLRARKRESRPRSEEVAPAQASAAAAGTFAPNDTDVGLASQRGGADEVDPLEEAEIFLAYGRDAQAEELLKEALSTNPAQFEIHAKLLEIYARRKDKEAFEKLAKQVQQGTGGEGEIWQRVLRLGYSIDPADPKYAEGKSDDADAADSEAEDTSPTSSRLDFEVGIGDDAESTSPTDFDPSSTADFQDSSVVDPDTTAEGSFDEEAPSDEIDMTDAGLTATDLDLNAELPMLDAEGTSEEAPEKQASAPMEDPGLDFNIEGISFGSGSAEEAKESSDDTLSEMPALDLSGISLDMDGTTTNETGGSGKDEKWYEVQTKFDLAKAYQEMGDNDGAKEILQEVISEGDSEQKAAAESVLASLD